LEKRRRAGAALADTVIPTRARSRDHDPLAAALDTRDDVLALPRRSVPVDHERRRAAGTRRFDERRGIVRGQDRRRYRYERLVGRSVQRDRFAGRAGRDDHDADGAGAGDLAHRLTDAAAREERSMAAERCDEERDASANVTNLVLDQRERRRDARTLRRQDGRLRVYAYARRAGRETGVALDEERRRELGFGHRVADSPQPFRDPVGRRRIARARRELQAEACVPLEVRVQARDEIAVVLLRVE